MFSKFFLLIAYFNSSKTIVDNSKAVTVYQYPKCQLRPSPTYFDLIKPQSIKIHTHNKNEIKKNKTNLRG